MMPKKYIDVDKIHDVIASHFCACSDETEAALHSVWGELKAVPGEDVAEIRRGHWIYERYGGMWPAGRPRPTQKCDQCGEWHYRDSRYCPECGALMEAAS